MLTTNYIPQGMDDYFGNQEAVVNIVEFITNFKSGKGFLLHGPPGCGKTSLVYAIAREFEFNVVELNASDERNTAELKAKSAGCFFNSLDKKNIYLLDEADHCRHNNQLVKMLKLSKVPIILTANYYRKVPSAVKKLVIKQEIKFPTKNNLMKFVKSVCSKEGIITSDGEKTEICEKCKTYRQVLMVLERGDWSDIPEINYVGDLDDLAQIKMIFAGESLENVNISIQPFLFCYWLIANNLYKEALHMDRILAISRQQWGVGRMAKAYMLSVRKEGYTKYPKWKMRKKEEVIVEKKEPKFKKLIITNKVKVSIKNNANINEKKEVINGLDNWV